MESRNRFFGFSRIHRFRFFGNVNDITEKPVFKKTVFPTSKTGFSVSVSVFYENGKKICRFLAICARDIHGMKNII